MFLIADSESTHKVRYTGKFSGWMSTFMESWAPNLDLGQNPVFAVREQLHRFGTKLTLNLDSPWSKVPSPTWNVRHSLYIFLTCQLEFLNYQVVLVHSSTQLGISSGGAELPTPTIHLPQLLVETIAERMQANALKQRNSSTYLQAFYHFITAQYSA